MKRTLSVLLAALMLLGMSTAALADDAKTISYYAFWCGDHEEGSYIETSIEEALGIDIKVQKVAHTDGEAVNLMIAQEMPDCGWFNKGLAYMMDQELIRPIPIDMVREYAPSLAAKMDEIPMLWAQATDPEDSTQLLYLPDMYQTYVDLYLDAHYIRYDWIQNLGIDLGDIQVEQLSDRLYIADRGIGIDLLAEIMEKFNTADPDGDGVDNTEGMTHGWTQIMSAFGITEGNNKAEDGSVQMYYTDPRWKEVLKFMAEQYAAGNVYTEIFTVGWGQDWELINSELSGIHLGSSTNSLNGWANNRPPRTILTIDDPANPASLLMIPGFADAEGKTISLGQPSAAGGEKFYIRWDVSDEKLVEILKFYEYTNWNADPSVTATIWLGEEGVDWQWNEDKTQPIDVDGKPRLVGGEKDAQIFGRNTQMGKAWEWLTFEEWFTAGAKYYVSYMGGIWNEGIVYDYKYDVYQETDAATISNEYSADWGQIRDAFALDVITGVKDAEADWDAYIAELNDVCYGDYLAELEKAPATLDVIASFAN